MWQLKEISLFPLFISKRGGWTSTSQTIETALLSIGLATLDQKLLSTTCWL